MAITPLSGGDLEIEAGASGEVSFTYRLPIPGTDPVQYQDANLDGYSAHFQVRQTASSPTAAISKTPPFDGTTVALSLTAAETALLTMRFYRYGIELHGPEAGEPVIRLVQAKVKVSEEVVRG